MIPHHIYIAIIESPAGKLINRLIAEEYARGGDPRTHGENICGSHGSIIDQLYETITTVQKKQRMDRRKVYKQERLAKYQSFVQEPQTVQWTNIGDLTSFNPVESGREPIKGKPDE